MHAVDAPQTHGTAGQGGAPVGEPKEPASADAGASTLGDKQPVVGAAGEGAGNSAGGGASAGAPSASAGESSAAGAGTEPIGPEPSCGKQLDGTLCGANMTPPGVDGTRYFCADGEVLAEAGCPGACDVETNSCVQSGGTGSGSGETSLLAALHCPACYEIACYDELTTCRGDARCRAHLSCLESCSLENECFATCDAVFAGEKILAELDQCADETGCAAQCPTEERP